jgi:hypothetical protein
VRLCVCIGRTRGSNNLQLMKQIVDCVVWEFCFELDPKSRVDKVPSEQCARVYRGLDKSDPYASYESS